MEEDMLDLSLKEPIYKHGHIQVATFFGGPLAATYAIADNFKKLGHPEKIRKTWIWGIFGFILFLLLAFLIPAFWKIPTMVMPLICLFIASVITRKTQRDEIIRYIKEDGPVYSIWRAIALGLISLLVTLALLVIVLFACDYFFGWNPVL